MPDKMKVLVIIPGKFPKVEEIDRGLESLQKAVGGFIEAVYPFTDPVAMICNENGKCEGLCPNRALKDDDGDVYDIVCGTFLIVGLGEEDFDSLPEKYLEKYEKEFHHPELFFRDEAKGGVSVFRCDYED